MRHQSLALGWLALTLVGACRPAPKAVARGGDWDQFVDRFLEAYFAANPGFAVYQGRHDFDGKLPDWSEAGLASAVAQLRAARDSAMAWDTTGLDAPRRLQRQYLVDVIEGQLFWRDEAKWPTKNPTWYADNLDPNVYIARPYADPTVRARALTAWARAVPRAADQIKANLRLPLPKSYVAIGRIRFGGLVGFLRNDAPKAFASVEDSPVRASLDSALTAAAESMHRLDQWFASQEKTAVDSFAMGPQLFARMLHATDRVDVPLDRLEALGRADLDRNIAALKEACAAFAKGQALEACVEKANDIKPAGPIVEAARLQLDSLAAFVRAKDLVTVPGTEKAQVHESPPYQRWNFAYIDPPGPYDKGLPSVYYVAPPEPSWSKKEQHDYLPGRANLEFTSVHEVWPLRPVPPLQSVGGQVRRGVRDLRLRGGLGPLCRGDDVGGGPGERESRSAHRPAAERAAPRCPLSLGHRDAHRAYDPGAIGAALPGGRLTGRGDGAAAGGAGDVRSRVSQLHAGQADDPPVAGGLDGDARWARGVEGVSRPVSLVRRAAGAAGAGGDAGGGGGGGAEVGRAPGR
jgi:Bacterial protein of unknown function (DUF885)